MVYKKELTKDVPLLKNHLKLGGKNKNESIEVTSRYIEKNGKPWIPVMGEYHFSRADSGEWKRELLKMKAGGINTVAAYVIWIHHEEEEGKISFEGNLDIRKFVETCFECGLYVLLRIGPWIHGEVKNGGFPDWLVKKEGIVLRSNNDIYLKYCKGWYEALSDQLKGLMFDDGTKFIGFQIENELMRDEEHLKVLLDMAIECGLKAPLYTATAWGIPSDADIPDGRFLPMFGAYPERPWTNHIEKLEPSKHYFFSSMRNDHTIGADLCVRAESNADAIDYDKYPFATCEMGGGVQSTYPRRPIITGTDVAAITNAKLGSGANLIGYYMYHGGRNPVGKTTTMQETKKSGYPNDLPAIDYDFQTQLGAWGSVRPHYSLCRLPALFLEDFGEFFAECRPYFQSEKIYSVFDDKTLRYSMRLKESRGFVFINNYCREMKLSEHKNVRFLVDEFEFPKTPLSIKDGEFGFFPYNIMLGDVSLLYSVMQPLCKYKNSYFFFPPFDGHGEMCFDCGTVAEIKGDAEIIYEDEKVYVKNAKGCIAVTGKSGDIIKIEVLSKEDALHISRQNGRIYLSESELYSDENGVYIYGCDLNKLNCKVYTENGFSDCAVEKNNLNCEEKLLTIKETEPFESVYMEEFELGVNAERKFFEIELPKERENLILSFDITGDIAQLYADGEFAADTFLNGRRWYVGPDRFLNCKKLILVVSELSPEGKYLETEKNSGLSINSITAKRLYNLKVGIKEENK